MTINKKIELGVLFDIQKAATEENEPIIIEGYANTVDKDRHGDIIPTEAWTKGGLVNFLKNPILLAFHNHSKPAGKVTELTVDQNGLKIKAEVHSFQKEVYDAVKNGVLKAFSIGASIKDLIYDRDNDVFVIKDLELYEVSVVSVPANQDSLFSVSKAFASDEEFKEFKKQFLPTEQGAEGQQVEEGKDSQEKELNMTKEELESLIKSTLSSALDAQAQKAADEAAAKAKADAEALAAIQLAESGAEKLLKEVQTRVDKSVEEGIQLKLKDLESVIAEKATEISATLTNKMKFSDRQPGDDGISLKEKETAFILAKALNKPITATKFAQRLIEKAGPHMSATNGDDWELTISTNMQDDIRRALIVAPLFRSITMPTPTMRLPINPEAGYANWVAPANYGTSASSGTAQTHQLAEVTLNSYKLATKEYMTNEEEEDTIIALAPIIRDAVVRRMSKAIDKAFLRGQGSGATDPLAGIATVGDEVGTTESLAIANKATVATLRAMRRKLGVLGLDPAAIRFIVSTEVYYDLLDDAEFQTMDKVGDRATILNGQIGFAGGTPIIVSGEFEAKAATKVGAVAVLPTNFVVGEHRGMKVESDYSVENQQRVLVASRRLAFQQVHAADGYGVAILRWTAT
jgi:HK97 family phage prohead protease/HK97 family phage major capsid protein